MALTETQAGFGSHGTSATSVTIAIGTLIPAGSLGVLVIAIDNAGAAGSVAALPSSVNDSAGNTWTLRQDAIFDPGAASAGVELGIYTGAMVTDLTTSGTIVLNFVAAVSVVAKAWALSYFSGAAGSTLSFVTGANGTGSTTGTPTITTGSIPSGDGVIGAAGAESADTWTQDSDTTNGSWSSQNSQHTSVGTGTSGITVQTQRKIVTATGTQTYNPTLTSVDTILAWAQVHETLAPEDPAPIFGGGYYF